MASLDDQDLACPSSPTLPDNHDTVAEHHGSSLTSQQQNAMALVSGQEMDKVDEHADASVVGSTSHEAETHIIDSSPLSSRHAMVEPLSPALQVTTQNTSGAPSSQAALPIPPAADSSMTKGVSLYISEQQLRSSYAYCFDRGNGTYSRLVALDALPPLNNVPALQDNCLGMVVLPNPQAPAPPGGEIGVLDGRSWKMHSEPPAGDVQSTIDSIVDSTTTPTSSRTLSMAPSRGQLAYEAPQHLQLLHPQHRQRGLTPRNSSSGSGHGHGHGGGGGGGDETNFTQHSDGPSSGRRDNNTNTNTNGSSSSKRTKIYCDKWVHEGVCAFTQQGCKFKHEMPLDRATQHSLGLFHGLPAWWKKQQAEVAKQAGIAGGNAATGGGGSSSDLIRNPAQHHHQQQRAQHLREQAQQQAQPVYMLQSGTVHDMDSLAQHFQGRQQLPADYGSDVSQGLATATATQQQRQQLQYSDMNSNNTNNNPAEFYTTSHHGHHENLQGASFDAVTNQFQITGQQGQYLAYPQHTTLGGIGYGSRDGGDEEDFSPANYGGNLNVGDSSTYYAQGGGLVSDLPLRRGVQGQIWRQNQLFNPADAMVGSGTVQSVPVSQSFPAFHPDDGSQSEYSAGGHHGQREHRGTNASFEFPQTHDNDDDHMSTNTQSASNGRSRGNTSMSTFASRFGPIAPPPTHALSQLGSSPLTSTGLSMINTDSPFRSSGSKLQAGGTPTGGGFWATNATARQPFSASAATFPQSPTVVRQQQQQQQQSSRQQHQQSRLRGSVHSGTAQHSSSPIAGNLGNGGTDNHSHRGGKKGNTKLGLSSENTRGNAAHNRNPWRSVSESDGAKDEQVDKEW